VFIPSDCPHVVLTLATSVAISVDLINNANLARISPDVKTLLLVPSHTLAQ
jgi:hypothetical protein